MNDDLAGFLISAIIIIVLVGLMVVIGNYKENRQCDILAKGGTQVHIEDFFLIQERCFVELESGVIINADNYRGIAD